MDEIIRLEALDGLWEVGGHDRRRGVWPEDLQCSWDDWGPKTASFTLKRDPAAVYPDLTSLTPVDIEKDYGIWEGFVDEVATTDEYSLHVEAIGWPDYANDDLERKMYVHSNLTEWKDQRSYIDADLTRFNAAGRVEVGDGAMIIGQANGSVWANDKIQGVTLDVGVSSTAKRIVIEVEQINLNGNAVFDVYVRGHDTPGGLLGIFEDVVTELNGAIASTTYSGTFTTPRRYITIMLVWQGAGGTTGNDHLLRITAARVFAATAYESGNVSILKTSDVLKDAMPRLCPEWSSDITGIDNTLLNLPHFAPSEQRNFREIAEGLNSVHGYVRKLERGRRFRFKVRPTIPVLAAGEWPGVTYRDAHKSASRELYNKAVATGTNGAGEPVFVERHAGQQPGVTGELTAGFFTNPDFEVNTAGWTASAGTTITRDTGQPRTGTASGRWSSATNYFAPGQSLETTLSGTFERGVVYRVSLYLKTTSGTFPFPSVINDTKVMTMALGTSTDRAVSPRIRYFGPFGGPWQVFQVVWVPRATVASGVKLTIANTGSGNVSYDSPSTTGVYFDDFQMEILQPTLLDRRGRVRVKQVSIPSQSVDQGVMEAFADVWLQSHMRTPARGDLTVNGQTLRDFSSGRSVSPFEVGERTGELVCLLDELDPDTGGLGRDVVIAAVSYDGNTETASITLDSSSEDFEKVVARYDVIAGGGNIS